MPIVKNPMPKPKNYTEAIRRARSFCINRCCSKNYGAFLNCQDTSCEWWSSRLEPEQISCIDVSLRPAFYEKFDSVFAEMRGEITIIDVKEKCHEKYNGELGAICNNWWGTAMRRSAIRHGARKIGNKASTASRSRGHNIAVWWVD